MKQITCPHCGDTYPDFDVAHVCSRGPYAVKLKPKMNERMRQLAEQAGFMEAWFSESGDDCEREIKKFAELIIRECMACSTWVGKMNTNSCEPIQTAHAINQRIKQQFGVEE